jgi:hypothetical protein
MQIRSWFFTSFIRNVIKVQGPCEAELTPTEINMQPQLVVVNSQLSIVWLSSMKVRKQMSRSIKSSPALPRLS